MNTRQKLTLGIAAIFMVTLTIVGVTYAYFVTRVTGAVTESVNVSTVTLGDVVYVPGNGDSDVVTLEDVIPGTAVYKSFSVKNTNAKTLAQGAAPSYFNIITSNSVTTGAEHFIHTAADATSGRKAGSNDGLQATCYGYTGGTLNTGVDYTRAEQPLKYSEATTTKTTCFAEEDAIYNNIRLTLWQVPNAITDIINSDPSGEGVTLLEDAVQTAYNAENEVLHDGTDGNGVLINPGNGAADTNSLYHYVLKVEYVDTADTDDAINGSVANDENQNAENEAGLDILVSIEAA